MYKKYLVIIVLSYQQLLVNVSAESEPSSEEVRRHLPVAKESYELLGQLACSKILNNNETAIPRCVENFTTVEPTSSILPPEVIIRCQRTNTLRFQTEPTENWQLVVLIDETNKGFYYITYSLISSNTVFDEIDSNKDGNYTVWNTVLYENLVPSAWRKGVTVYPVVDHPVEPMKHTIHTNFTNSETDNMTMTATYTWNRLSENDSCFDFMNTCVNYKDYATQTWSDTIPQITLHNLQPNDECTVIVTGIHGATILPYTTPPCIDTDKCLPDKPETPQNISLEAKENPFSRAWNVEVSWLPPSITPDRYNITLETESGLFRNIIVPGNATKAVFPYVESHHSFEMYEVSLDAIKGEFASHTSRMAPFPHHRTPMWPIIIAGGGLAVTLVTLFGVALYLRRRKYDPPPPFFLPREVSTKKAAGTKGGPEDLWEVDSDRLLLHEQLGEGAFGVVRRATLTPQHTSVAVKMLKDFPTIEDIRSFHAEIELMKSVGAHAHVVSLVGCCSGARPMIIAEYCSRGDLLTYLRYSWNVMVANRHTKYYNNNTVEQSDLKDDLYKCKVETEDSKLVVNKLYDIQGLCDVELTSSDLLSFCRQIASGMKFLSSNRVVHRDLAARNVLVTSDKTLKIADFGLSRDIYAENQYKQKGNGRLPVKWMAPESLTRRIFTSQSDVWSFGVVVWEIVTVGGSPYTGVAAARLPSLLREGYRMPCPNNCSQQLYELMLSCWNEHPCNRPSFPDLHEQLDRLLSTASADQYLSLELDAGDPPPTNTSKGYKYLRNLLRGRRTYERVKSYERPLKPITNRYTSLPITTAKAQAV